MGLTQEQINYPKDIFLELITENSPYAFYLFQWVPYQSEANKYRLKLNHDVKSFSGEVQECIWPNGEHCGKFHDDEVEFIRISKNQCGHKYIDPRR